MERKREATTHTSDSKKKNDTSGSCGTGTAVESNLEVRAAQMKVDDDWTNLMILSDGHSVTQDKKKRARFHRSFEARDEVVKRVCRQLQVMYCECCGLEQPMATAVCPCVHYP